MFGRVSRAWNGRAVRASSIKIRIKTGLSGLQIRAYPID